MKTIEQINKLIKNPTFRANLVNDTHTYVQQLGYVKTEGVDFKVVTNTRATFYYVMPNYNDGAHHNAEMDEEMLQLHAGNTSTLGSVGTASSVFTVCTTASSAGSVASASTAGCASDVNVS